MRKLIVLRIFAEKSKLSLAHKHGCWTELWIPLRFTESHNFHPRG